jgi:hypothetical protein
MTVKEMEPVRQTASALFRFPFSFCKGAGEATVTRYHPSVFVLWNGVESFLNYLGVRQVVWKIVAQFVEK